MPAISALSRLCLVAGAVIGLSGCIVTPLQPLPDDRGAGSGQYPESPSGQTDSSGVDVSPVSPIDAPQSIPDGRSEPPPPLTNPALGALVGRAQQFSQQGQWDLAAAELERGVRIAPQDGQVWLLLAEARFQQGQYAQASQLARRALTLVPPGSGLAYRAQDLINRASGR